MITDAQIDAALDAWWRGIQSPSRQTVREILEAAEDAAWSKDITKAPTDGTKFLLLFLGEVIIASWSHVYSDDVRELVGHNVKWFDGQATVQTIKDGLGQFPEGLLWAPLSEPPQ